MRPTPTVDRHADLNQPDPSDTLAPFRVPADVALPLPGLTAPALGKLLRFGTLNRIYRLIQKRIEHDGLTETDLPFADRALHALGVHVAVPADHLARLPDTGPLVAVANHPYGGIEGLALLSMLLRVRPDAKLLANEMLCTVPELAERIFPVDVFAPAGDPRNASSIRRAMRHLRDGGCLGVFPAGEVSHLKLRRRCVTDPPWQDAAARLIQRADAHAACVFFEGRNSNAFQFAGLLHPKLRTVLLPTEMLRRRGQALPARVSHAIGPERIARLADPRKPKTLTAYFRARTYLLRNAEDPNPNDADETDPNPGLHEKTKAIAPSFADAPLAPPVDPAVVEAELAAAVEAQPQRLLLQSGRYDVIVADAHRLHATLPEIGRLRETCFRAVGEGTGQPLDLDRFDPHYHHLLVWNRDAKRIAGAYRLGPTDTLLRDAGLDGLYTATLFRYRKRLFDRLGPTLELGRSFVHPDEQRGFQPLQLLWKGIGRFVIAHPQYRYLLGPASISARYSDTSKLLLRKFLEAEAPKLTGLPGFTGLNKIKAIGTQPKPKNPHKPKRPRQLDRRAFSAVVAGLDEVNELVAELEADGKPMPVLLRQYLKLNATLLGFNVDPDFGEVLDALLLVDLAHAPASVLQRYLGPDHAEPWRRAALRR